MAKTFLERFSKAPDEGIHVSMRLKDALQKITERSKLDEIRVNQYVGLTKTNPPSKTSEIE
jgi:hypothetical protein